MKTEEAILLWMKLFGKEVKVWVVMYDPEDEDKDFIGLARTEKLAKKLIREDMKEYYRDRRDYVIWEQEVEM